eukprot:Skav211749  [mRNA]  locus=scaffold1548:493729:494568:- [translate_table: standard]
MTRVMFKPFDCTAVQMKRSSSSPTTAHLEVNESGMPVFFSLQRMLHKYAQFENAVLKTATYRALSLSQIQIDLESAQSFHQLVPYQGSDGGMDDDESSDGTKAMKQRAALLRRTLNPNKNGGQSRGSGNVRKPQAKQKTQTRGSRKAASKKPPQKDSDEIAEDPNEPGLAGHVHDETMIHWHGALEAQQGPIPPSNPKTQVVDVPKGMSCSASSSKLSDSKPSIAKFTIPIISKVHPWKAADGNCWKWNAEEERPQLLGLDPGLQMSLLSLPSEIWLKE